MAEQTTAAHRGLPVPTPPQHDAYRRDAADVAGLLAVVPATGLTTADAEQRAEAWGANELAEPARRPQWLRLLDQFRSWLTGILLAAAVLAGVIGEVRDALVVTVVLLVNATIGYLQERRAERSLEALRRMLVPTARVRRDGRVKTVPAGTLVPGDIVLLEAGDRVPADGRLAVAESVEAAEAALTGESQPVAKTTAPTAAHGAGPVPVAERTGMLFMNTALTRGRAELIVTATGMRTEVGAIAEALRTGAEPPGPLQVQMDSLGRRLALVSGAAVAAYALVALLRGEALADLALRAVALAVAAIPEGLPAVLALTLALGVHRMARRGAIVKRLAAVEALGSATVVCSDKTGTLTLNEMTARALWAAGRVYEVTGEGYDTTGTVRPARQQHARQLHARDPRGAAPCAARAYDAGADEVSGSDVSGSDVSGSDVSGSDVSGPDPGVPDLGVPDPGVPDASRSALREAVLPFALCNDARITPDGVVGDPTEAALAVLAAKAGVDAGLRDRTPRTGEIPFDPAAKYMATFHAGPDGRVRVHAKGAVDVLLERCTHVLTEQGRVPLDAGRRSEVADAARRMGGQGLRVLGAATATTGLPNPREAAGLTLTAIAGMADPPRPQARDAVALARAAGVTVKMITGDHADTATAVARELGITGDVVSGAELARMSERELADRIEDVGVFARVAPEHKVTVVRALSGKGHIVAMTGDGVNDAAALRAAHIGVAMGITGTDVAKEAADMVLTDDDFSTIVRAVREGRSVYDNIVTFVRFQLSTNIGAILTLLATVLAGLPAPLSAIQLLWVNIIMDGPPAMALGVDPPQDDAMRRPPRPPGERILNARRLTAVTRSGAVMAAGTLAVFAGARRLTDPASAATMAFTTFVLFQLCNALAARGEDGPVLGRHQLRNRTLWICLAAVLALQAVAVHVPVAREVFGTVPLSAAQWAVCLATASTVLLAEHAWRAGRHGAAGAGAGAGRAAPPPS